MKKKTTIAPPLVALLAATLCAASTGDEHTSALASIADIEAARAELVGVENSQVVGQPAFVHAAQRALNAIVGRDDKLYAAADGDPGDGTGAIGNIDLLLAGRDESLWSPAIRGAKANLRAVVVDLHDAMNEKDMESFGTDLTSALGNLALARGNPSEDGVLGGLGGALANTSLGVPPGATTVSGCKPASHGPVYGVVDGHLVYIALPRKSDSSLPLELSIGSVVEKGDAIVLYTRQADILCRNSDTHLRRTVQHDGEAEQPIDRGPTSMATTSTPLYKMTQAEAGIRLFAENCESCHGKNLQGVSAPGIAGTDFLSTVRSNHWTLADLRTIIFENMPPNNPTALTAEQYADIVAFVLASNCYPAGNVPFPEEEDPAFANVSLGPLSGVQPTDPRLGVCDVK